MKKIFKGPQRVCLKAKIKGLASEGTILRKKHKAAPKEDKFHFYYSKQFIKRDVRHYNLAYAYLRGVPYNVLEKRCNEKPNADQILKIVTAHNFWFSSDKEGLNKINNWLNGIEEIKCKPIIPSKSLSSATPVIKTQQQKSIPAKILRQICNFLDGSK
jgi:hypothetical protein